MPFAVFFFDIVFAIEGLLRKVGEFDRKYAFLEPEVKKFVNIRKKVQVVGVVDIWCNERKINE